MTDELISRQAAIDIVIKGSTELGEDYIPKWVRKDLESLPTIEERKIGRWILDEYPHDGDCRCSACGIAVDAMHERNHKSLNVLTGGKWWAFYKFCPQCGARMEASDEQ